MRALHNACAFWEQLPSLRLWRLQVRRLLGLLSSRPDGRRRVVAFEALAFRRRGRYCFHNRDCYCLCWWRQASGFLAPGGLLKPLLAAPHEWQGHCDANGREKGCGGPTAGGH